MNYIDETISFIQDTFESKVFIPLHEPHFAGNEKKYVLETIDSTFVSSVGAYVDKFEEKMQTITQTEKAVAVVNGTAAIQVALRISGVGLGDEVLTQALTFVATANAISYNGANPVFLDVDLDTMGLSPEAVKKFLDKNAVIRDNRCFNKYTKRKISACLPMHTFGFPARIHELVEICDSWKIPVIEDAAEALGSRIQEQPLGSFGSLGTFSFNGNKIVTSGGGGAIVTNDKHLGEKAKYLTTTAKKNHPFEYFHDELGYNFRMPNLNAALATAQLENLGAFLVEKRRLAGIYDAFFSRIGVKFRKERPGTKANYWLMAVELESKEERDDFLKATNEQGVMTRPIWTLMHKLPMYSNFERDEQLNAEYLENRIVNIPSSVKIPNLSL